ncbi:hypothetical protein L5D93_13280 [Paenibacillus thiaminolyticus]|nr:hypothetical protein [Paenibacillus thiaminolyticus]
MSIKLAKKMVKESFKNGIQGLRESLENMADNNKFGLKVAPAGGYIYSRQGTIKQPSGLTKNQKNYWNVMESNSGKTPQGKGGAGGTGNGATVSQIKAGDKTKGGREFTGHAAERANERGFTSEQIDNIINNNKNNRVKEIDPDDGSVTWRYQDKRGNTVITDEWGDKLVTVYSHPQSINGGKYIPKNR